MLDLYLCPACNKPLHNRYRIYQCENGHTFDMAKEGYVNLLLAQHKKSQQGGDNKQMVQSRRAFLEAGHYDLLPAALNDWLTRQVLSSGKSEDALKLVDLGCGEGFYTHQLNQQDISCLGLDISKAAIRAAAKRYKAIQFVVASSFRLPYANGSTDVVLKIFAPADPAEISRILVNQGWFISVQPGPNHLFALKKLLYDAPKPHVNDPSTVEHFKLMDSFLLEGSMKLEDPLDITNLLAMTPYFWKIPEQRRQTVTELDRLDCQIAFSVRFYQKI